MSMGGGGGGGGSVVQSTAPWASMEAGNIQAKAAQAAADALKDSTNQAILATRQMYNASQMSLKPYTSEGVQALNQMNYLMGLKPYDPGTAPVTPTAPTLEAYMNKVSKSDMLDYIRENSVTNGSSPGDGQKQGYVYQGVRDSSPNGEILWGDKGPQEVIAPGSPYEYDIRKELAGKDYQYAQDQYPELMNTYNNQMDLYNQAQTLKSEYAAKDPADINGYLSSLPGYQFTMNQGLDKVSRAAAAGGVLGSGRALQALTDYASGLASNTYGDTLNRLAAVAGMGANAAGQSSQNSMQQGGNLAQLNTQLGEGLANSFLASGAARANALVNANQQYNVMGGNDGGGGLGGIGSLISGVASMAGSGGGLSGLFSSRTLKELNRPISTREILDKVRDLDVEKWKYKNIDREHIGPYAEDFRQAFGVGDGQSINLIDYLGVLVASVKELAKQVEELKRGK